ncbi:MAG: APC family permease [Ignavibacteria bacterium]|jgi:APA family basic amino acid/polyamine antiporter
MNMQKQQLRFFDITMMVISLVIGMGIFRAPATVAQRAGSEEIYYAAWIVGGLIALCGAIGYAEIGKRMPVSGAYYSIFAKAYSPTLAFAINIIILVSNAASIAGVAIIGAEYVMPYAMGLPSTIIASIFIIVLYGLNLLGLRTSATVQNILMVIKLLMLGAIISALGILPPTETMTAIQSHSGGIWESFGLALIAVSFTYGGYQQTINFGGEVRNNDTMLPRAIILGVVIIIGIYLLANLAYVQVIGFTELAQSKFIAAIMMERLFGSTAALIVSMIIMISVFGYVNISMLSNPRVISAMGRDGVLPKLFAQSDETKGVSVSALTVFTAISLISVYAGESFEKILNYTIFIDSIGLGVGMATLYRLKGEPLSIMTHVVALIFISACVFTGLNIFMFDTNAGIYGSILFVTVMVLGFIITKRMSRITVE